MERDRDERSYIKRPKQLEHIRKQDELGLTASEYAAKIGVSARSVREWRQNNYEDVLRKRRKKK